MKLILATPGITPKDRRTLEYHLTRVLPAVKRRLGRSGPKITILRARLTSEGTNGHLLYHLTISLQLPGYPIVVQKDGNDLLLMTDQAEKALKKEITKVVSKFRRDYLHSKRRLEKDAFSAFVAASQGKLPTPKTNGASPGVADPESHPMFARLRPLLAPLYNFAREHIHTAELAHELPPDYLQPEDLVDQAIVSLIEANTSVMTNADALEQMLYRQIERMLAEEAGRHRPNNQEMISLQENAPVAETWAVTDPEVEEREYYQPFAALRMSDVLIDEHAVDPEHAISEIEEHRIILKNLSHFPSKARSAFFLNRVEGFEPYEIAMIQNRAEADVSKDIDTCVTALKDGWARLHGPKAHAGATAK